MLPVDGALIPAMNARKKGIFLMKQKHFCFCGGNMIIGLLDFLLWHIVKAIIKSCKNP